MKKYCQSPLEYYACFLLFAATALPDAGCYAGRGGSGTYEKPPVLKAAKQRFLLIRGAVTPRAQKELHGLGWTVHEHAQPRKKN